MKEAKQARKQEVKAGSSIESAYRVSKECSVNAKSGSMSAGS